MKRAEVWQEGLVWVSCVYLPKWNPGRDDHDAIHRIAVRDWPVAAWTDHHPTHAEALAHALAEVGLTPTSPEPMEAP